MKCFCFFLYYLIGVAVVGFSQNVAEDKYSKLLQLTDSLNLQKFNADSSKYQISCKIENLFIDILSDSNSYQFKFDLLKHVGIIYAPDQNFRIIQWNYIEKNGNGKHFGFIQFKPLQNGNSKIVILTECDEKFSKDELAIKRMSPKIWFGALYYKIIAVKTESGIIYTLLGTRYNSLFTTVKIIETLQVKADSLVVFGFPLIYVATKRINRMIFEYSNKVQMGLKYYENQNLIVFDHLAPDIPLHTNMYKYYGPDFSYDALKLEKNHWLFYSNVDYKQSEDEIRKGPKPKIIRSK